MSHSSLFEPYTKPVKYSKKLAPWVKEAQLREKRYPTANYGSKVMRRGTPDGVNAYGADWSSATDAQKLARRADGWTGNGAYWGNTLGSFLGDKIGMGSIGGAIGSGLENFVIDKGIDAVKGYRGSGAYCDNGYDGRGGYFGSSFGRMLGDKVGFGDLGASAMSGVEDWALDRGIDAAKKYRGSGAYELIGSGGHVENSLMNPISGDTIVPRIVGSNDEEGSMTLSHKEYVTDVYGVMGTSKNATFACNPNNRDLFPWLSGLAINFVEYQFEQLIFHFKSTTSNVGSSGALGTVILAANYNVTSGDFLNKITMMEQDGAVSAKTSCDVTFGVECDPEKNVGSANKLVLPSSRVPSSSELAMYNLANVQVLVNNPPLTGSVGELWVEYTVKLRKKAFSVDGNSYSNNVDMGFKTVNPSVVSNPLGWVDGNTIVMNNGRPIMTLLTNFDTVAAAVASVQMNKNRNLYKMCFNTSTSGGSTTYRMFVIFPDDVSGVFDITLFTGTSGIIAVPLGSDLQIVNYVLADQSVIIRVNMPSSANKLNKPNANVLSLGLALASGSVGAMGFFRADQVSATSMGV